jgi:glycosyl-4,4'-diaponeurosporenoate acyltransferase
MIFHLSSPWMLIIDFAAWLIINLSVSGIISLRRSGSFNDNSWLYRERAWERKSLIYESLFKVKKWKGWLPDGAKVSRTAFRKKRLLSSEPAYLTTFIQETCRAELLHWVIFIFWPIFFLWSPWYIGLMMFVYAALFNLPCVITQRYNRIKLNRIIGSANR